MEKTKKILMIFATAIILVAALFMLTGCGNKFDMKKMAGSYELIEMKDSDKNYSKEDIEQLKNYGLNFTIELKDDGTGSMDLFGEKSDLKYDDKGITVDDDTVSYTFEDNKLSLESDDTKMVFEKK